MDEQTRATRMTALARRAARRISCGARLLIRTGPFCVVRKALYTLQKKIKMIILHKGPAEHRDPGTSSLQGEPGTPPSVLTPQSPCTVGRAVGVGTLYRHCKLHTTFALHITR